MLRNLPKHPESNYVLREQFNNTICQQLKQIDQCGGHILVHGMPGSGKTVAVCQAVRQLIVDQDYFQPHGCRWIKIGTINLMMMLVGVINARKIVKVIGIPLYHDCRVH